MIQKSIFILILSCTGAGYFIGETEIGGSLPFINSEFHQVGKQKTIPKPKSFYSKRKTSNDFTGYATEQFSFFRVLNDPSLNKIVGLNGEIIKKYDSSPIAVLPSPPSMPKKAEVKAGRRSTPGPASRRSPAKIGSSVTRVASKLALRGADRKKSASVLPVPIEKASSKPVLALPPSIPQKAEVEAGRTSTLGPASHRSPAKIGSRGTRVASKVALRGGIGLVSYVVQVSSFRQKQQAEILKTVLGRKGYAAFISKTELPDNRGTWYRVYIGRYFNRAGAEMAATRFFREENRQAMVVRQTG